MDDHQNKSISPGHGKKRIKKTRGPTTCKKLKEKLTFKRLENTIEFDQYGNPIGMWADQFKSYIGTVVRLQVDINGQSWNMISEGLKDIIWDDIKNEWNIKDDVQKKQVLVTAGRCWRDFKSRLVTRFLEQGKDPCETYDFLTKEQWEKFKMTHESEEFKLKSDKARENQKLNKHPHFLGKGGYAAKRTKWLVDDPIASLSMYESMDTSTVSDESTGRLYDWVRARTKKTEDGGYYFPKEHTKEVFEKMGQWKTKITEGSWTPHGNDDILTRVLGNKEHGGRVIGVGGLARMKDVFGSEKSTQHSGVVSVNDLTVITKDIETKISKRLREEHKEELAIMREEYNSKLSGILNHFKQMGMPFPENIFDNGTPTNELLRSSCESVDPHQFPHIEKPTPCHLCVLINDSDKVIVASGTVFPSIFPGSSLIHGEEIASTNVKVSVDDIVAEYKLVPLPMPSQEHTKVGDAEGSFVQWPKSLVILGQESLLHENRETRSTPNHIGSKGSATNIHKDKLSLVSDDDLQQLSKKCQNLHAMIMTLPTSLEALEVIKDSEVFKNNLNKEVSIFVTREDVADFLKLNWLDVSILQVYMMYIHKLCMDLDDDSFGFMCPSELALARERPDSTTTYMTSVLLDCKTKRFILAPYFQDKHWMLLLIACQESTVYLFDSLKKKRNIYIKGLLGVAFRSYVVQGGRKFKNKLSWCDNEIKCPQQRGGTECGYYVMRYMHEIVRLYTKDPKINVKEVLGVKSYTAQQLDKIRDDWAEYFIDECF